MPRPCSSMSSGTKTFLRMDESPLGAQMATPSGGLKNCPAGPLLRNAFDSHMS